MVPEDRLLRNNKRYDLERFFRQIHVYVCFLRTDGFGRISQFTLNLLREVVWDNRQHA